MHRSAYYITTSVLQDAVDQTTGKSLLTKPDVAVPKKTLAHSRPKLAELTLNSRPAKAAPSLRKWTTNVLFKQSGHNI